jgi:cyanophycin synthetase
MEELAERETCEFGDFNDRLIALLPGLEEHHCGLGRRAASSNGFGRHLLFAYDGAHCVGADRRGWTVGNRGKTVWSGTPGVYFGGSRVQIRSGMRSLLTLRCRPGDTRSRGERFDVDAAVKAQSCRAGLGARAEHSRHRRRRRAARHSHGFERTSRA